ncbi:EAL domain-containing protein [Halarcobacter sp.]|uniref:EAL domain-containing protein n=1 Tax=Halarcobacter sp. TaxID=2321133 RepID=UPI0029F59A09|nr:EAL domain-containing protein [Halarcobacter sp.]
MPNIKHTKIKILYIEDDLVVQKSISNILKMIVSTVHCASNGEEAISILEKENYQLDIIITDIRMPKLNGLKLVEHLREKNLEIPVIITTAFNDIEYLKKAIELKIDKFIEKPIDLNSLLKEVEKIINIVTTKKELERKKIQLENYKKVINLTNYVVELTPDGQITSVSDNLKAFFKENLGFEIEFNNLFQVGQHYDYENEEIGSKDKIREVMFSKIMNFEIFSKDIVLNINKNFFTLNMTGFASYIEEDEIKTISIILKNLTDTLRKKNEKIEELYKDLVTELPNRHSLINYLNKEEKKASLVLVSLDNFKKYKQTYGFVFADNILKNLANEIKNYSLKIDSNKKTFYKLESSIFAIVVEINEDSTTNQIKEFAQKLIDYFDKYIVKIDKLTIDISVTIGSSTLGTTDLLLESFIALDAAYTSKSPYKCYKELKNPKDIYIKNITMQQKVKKALAKDLVVPYFQPIVDKNMNLIKYESLARVIDPDDNKNIISPYFFLDVVQDSKVYEIFTMTMIKKSIEASLLFKQSISINLSYEDITNPVIINYLEKVLKNHPYPITLEFLESEGLQDIEKTNNFCSIMKSYGAKIAIDDFGSGYSNYDYFFDVPLDVIKLDGSIVKRITDYKGYILIESIVSFAKKLDIKVIAEFVEDEIIFEKLKSLDVDYYQGYYFDKPKPLEEILKKT